MARYRCILASQMFDDLKDGLSHSIAFGNDWSEYAGVDCKVTTTANDPIVVGDIMECVDDGTGEELKAEVLSRYSLGGVTILNVDVTYAKLIFELNGIPKVSVNQLNSKKHWGLRKTTKDLITTEVWKQLGKTRIYYKCRVEYTFLFKDRPLDATNCYGMMKMIEDVMVVDDSAGYILSNKVTSLMDETVPAKKAKVIVKIIY